MALGSILSAAAPIVGGLLGAKGGAKGGKTSTTETRDPWAGVQPFLKDIYSQAQQQYQGFQPQFYPGQTFAPFDPLQLEGQRMALQYITGRSDLPGLAMPPMPSEIPSWGPQPPGAMPDATNMAGMLGGMGGFDPMLGGFNIPMGMGQQGGQMGPTTQPMPDYMMQGQMPAPPSQASPIVSAILQSMQQGGDPLAVFRGGR